MNQLFAGPTTPQDRSLEVWAPPRSLATTCGITIVFSSSGYLDVSVPRVSSHLRGSSNFIRRGFPIRTSTDQNSFAAPRSFSQLTTSFVVSESQGIPHTPLFASYRSTDSPFAYCCQHFFPLAVALKSSSHSSTIHNHQHSSPTQRPTTNTNS